MALRACRALFLTFALDAAAHALAQPTNPSTFFVPVPRLPRANEVVWFWSEFPPAGRVTVRAETAGATPITLEPTAMGHLPGVSLPAGWYVLEHFGAGGDVPTQTLRFVVSRTGPLTVVEYFHDALDQYFYTGDAQEIAMLDGGTITGWQRTGEAFHALPPAEIPGFGEPVCRFVGVPGSSASAAAHFYSAGPAECAAVLERWPDRWVLETDNAFGVITPHYPLDCDRPLFRLYRDGPRAGHRYTTSGALRDSMVLQGWIAEVAPFDGPYEAPYTMCVLP